ncbi:hypothetical protein [Streptomyces sp. NPDC014793]|uniref:hypothetical protein n=1 Tax=Streptomyces sp. NPDC014793 TaxID=3364914 RepID=UPI003702F59A
MRRTTTLALAAAGLLLAGCGSQSGGDGGDDTGGGSGKVSPSASGSPSSGTCVSHAELTAADNGHTVCLTKGGELRLTLDGTKDRPWKPVAASGPALEAINSGFVIQPGDATAAYRAKAAGTTKLTSSRPMCPEPTASGQVSCKGVQEWAVTVTVRQ